MDRHKQHASAHVVMIAAGMPHEEVVQHARAHGVSAEHLAALDVDPEQEDARRLLERLLSRGVH